MYPRKRDFFVIENILRTSNRRNKDVPDLLESIMRPTDPVKEELRRILFKMSQYRPEIIKIRVSTFWMSGKSTDSRRRPTQQASLVSFNAIAASQTRKISKNVGWAPAGPDC